MVKDQPLTDHNPDHQPPDTSSLPHQKRTDDGSIIDQSNQTVEGNQTNVAGNYNITSTYVEWVQSNTGLFYGFIIGVLALVALVILYLVSQGDGRTTSSVTSTSTDLVTAATATDERATVAVTTVAATATVTSTAVVTETSSEEPPAAVATIPVSVADDCLAHYAADFPQENVAVFEEGIRSQRIQRNEVNELILRLTELQEPIGLAHILLLPEQNSFKIKMILDAKCEPVVPDGGTGVNNWSVFEFSLQDVHYGIRLGFYSPTQIRSGGLRRTD